MTTKEKKFFLAAIREQIQKYKDTIDAQYEYRGLVGDCPMCDSYIISHNGFHHSPKTSCRNCPSLNFRIFNFEDGPGYPCLYRRTYPSRIKEFLNDDQIDNYEYQGEKAALQFWEKMFKFVKKTPARLISFEENHSFVNHMLWIDKTIAIEWETKIKSEQNERTA